VSPSDSKWGAFSCRAENGVYLSSHIPAEPTLFAKPILGRSLVNQTEGAIYHSAFYHDTHDDVT